MKRQKVRMGIILLSFFLFPATYYYLSPVLILQASFEGVINGSWCVFALLFLSSLIVGRGFCGWLCPAAGCQEAIFTVNDSLITKGDKLKWFIWIPWITAILFLTYKAGGYRTVDFFYQTVYGFSITNVQSSITYFCVLLFLIVLPALVIGRRSFCHHLCWMAPFMISGRTLARRVKLPCLELQSDKTKCIHCHTCTVNCPMSLPVEDMIAQGRLENRECILCGSCVDVCNNEVIHFSMKK